MSEAGTEAFWRVLLRCQSSRQDDGDPQNVVKHKGQAKPCSISQNCRLEDSTAVFM